MSWAPRELKQNCCDFKASLDYRVRFCLKRGRGIVMRTCNPSIQEAEAGGLLGI